MWKTVKLGDICKIVNGSTPSRKEKTFWEDGDISWFTIDDMREQGRDIFATAQHVTQRAVEEKKVKLVPANSVLLCCTASIGEAAIARKEMGTNQQFNSLTPLTNDLSCEYLYYVATTLKDKLLRVSGSTTISFVSMGKLKEIEIPLPPLAEQQRIVAKLDAAFAEIDRAMAFTDGSIADASAIYEQQLLRIFETPHSSWAKSSLEEITHQITDGKHGDCKNESNSGYYFLSAKDIRDGTLSYNGAREITKDDFDETHRRTRLEPGDILITNSGTIGRMAIAPEHERTSRTTFQKSVAIIKPVNGLISTTYLYFSLKSKVVQLQKISQGAAQKNLLLRDLRALEIAYPTTASEQEAVGKELGTLENQCLYLSRLAERKRTELSALKSAILSQELQPPQSEAA